MVSAAAKVTKRGVEVGIRIRKRSAVEVGTERIGIVNVRGHVTANGRAGLHGGAVVGVLARVQ